MSTDTQTPAFEVIVRAAAAYPSTTNLTVRLGFVEEPADDAKEQVREQIAAMYEDAFGATPARVAVAVLPWPGEDDE